MIFPIGFEEFALNYFIPFILFFSIFYALLQLLKIFGEPTTQLARKTNAIIAFSIALLTIWINPLGIKFGDFLAKLFTGTSLLILALVFLIFFSAMVSVAAGIIPRGWLSLVVGLGLVILVFSTAGVLELLETIPPAMLDWGIVGVVVIVFVFVGIVYWLFKHS